MECLLELFPLRRQPGGVAAACLLEDAEWVRHWERLHARYENSGVEVEYAADGELRLRHRRGELQVRGWPHIQASLRSGEDGQTHLEALKGFLVPRRVSNAFAATVEWLQGNVCADNARKLIWEDWPLDLARMEAVYRFSENFPETVLEQIFGMRFPAGHLPLAAALRVPGFELLLEAHPQLAWLVAMVLWQRREPNQPVPVAEWAAVIRQGPLWLLKYFLRLPPRRTVLEALRRLGFQVLEPRTKRLKVFSFYS